MRKLALLALIAGCSSSTAPGVGRLTVTMTAPTNVTSTVTVTGPSGYQKTLTSTATLTDLAPGSYALTAADVSTSDSIVATVFHATITGSPASVTAGGSATATVNYAARPGSGGLWIVGGSADGLNIANMAFEYTGAQLRSSSSALPAVQLQFPVTAGGNIDANAVAFDGHGDLWVVNDNSNTVVEYAPSALGANGSPTATVTMHLPDSSYTDALAFDAKGNLWVLSEDSANIAEFTPTQLASGGSPAPAVTIHMAPLQGQSGNPLSMAFDGQGNLWVVNGGQVELVEYPANQLTSSATLAPAVQINPQVPYPYTIAFDKVGNLWVGTSGYGSTTGGITTDYPGKITELAASSLTASGNPAPAVTLTLPNGVNTYPTTLAFDDSGDLWYSDFTHSTVGELTPAQLAASGNPTPTVAIVYGGTPRFFGTAIAFNPHTAAVPLH